MKLQELQGEIKGEKALALRIYSVLFLFLDSDFLLFHVFIHVQYECTIYSQELQTMQIKVFLASARRKKTLLYNDFFNSCIKKNAAYMQQ